MAITYTLKITDIRVSPQANGQTDVVTSVGWAYVGTDGANTAAFGGTTDITYTQGNPFVPYSQLTQDQVVGWVLGAWTPDQTQERQAAIAEQLNAVPATPPWGTSE